MSLFLLPTMEYLLTTYRVENEEGTAVFRNLASLRRGFGLHFQFRSPHTVPVTVNEKRGANANIISHDGKRLNFAKISAPLPLIRSIKGDHFQPNPSRSRVQ
jgi:hypothetical protein